MSLYLERLSSGSARPTLGPAIALGMALLARFIASRVHSVEFPQTVTCFPQTVSCGACNCMAMVTFCGSFAAVKSSASSTRSCNGDVTPFSEKAGDLPVIIELVLLKTAKTPGLTVSPTLLARADEVFEKAFLAALRESANVLVFGRRQQRGLRTLPRSGLERSDFV